MKKKQVNQPGEQVWGKGQEIGDEVEGEEVVDKHERRGDGGEDGDEGEGEWGQGGRQRG